MPVPLEPTVSQFNLPVIDISEFQQDFDAQDLTHLQDHPVLAKLRKACKEWGFFLLVNHGIPVDLLEMAENVCRDLLSLPTEVKERVSASGNAFDGYYRRPNFEAFHLPDPTNPASIAQLYAEIFPEGNPIFCKTMATYSLSVSNLERKITKMIIASLGLDANAFYHSHFENRRAVLRINGYPSNDISIGQEALGPHTDLNSLTILYQDDVGGLQIRSEEGEWFVVKPLPHSFVVNVGDSLKAWSNGRYRSAEHRVVYNGCKGRISIGIFTGFPVDAEIWAPMELVDDDNPRRYKPFIYSHFKQYSLKAKENTERAKHLEIFAGI